MNDSPIHNKLENQEYGAFIGLDWADDKHALCLYEVDSQMVEESSRYFYLDRLMPTVIGIDKKLAIRAPFSRDTLG